MVAVTIKNAHRRFTVWQDVPLDPRNDASQTATRVLAKEHSTNFALDSVLLVVGLLRWQTGSIPVRSVKTRLC